MVDVGLSFASGRLGGCDDTGIMKFNTDVESLRSALTQARSVISPRASLMARTGALIEAVGGANPVRITGASDDMSVVAAVTAAKSLDKGKALVVPAPLGTYLAALPGDTEITVYTTETDLFVDVGNDHPYQFRLMQDSFPTPPAPNGARTSVNLGLLGSAVAAVKRSMDAEGVVRLTSDDDDVNLASTDSFRLTQATLVGAGFGEFSAVLPNVAVSSIAKVEPHSLKFDKKSINATSDTMSVSARNLVATTFPDVNLVLDQKPSSTFRIAREELAAALQRLSAVGPDEPVQLAISQGHLSLILSGSGVGRGQEDLAIDGGPTTTFMVSLNLRFLLDAAHSHSAEHVIVGFSGPTKPIFVKSGERLVVTSALMPLAGSEQS